MLLSARLLSDVQNVNSFEYVDVLRWTQGDRPDIYIQLVDLNRGQPNHYPKGMRYATRGEGELAPVLVVTVKDVLSSFNLQGVQPFPQDLSIWRLPYGEMTSTFVDTLVGTYGLKLKLIDDGETIYGFVPQAISIARTSPEF